MVRRARRKRRYFKERAIWSITAEKGGTGQEGESHFNDLKRGIKNPLRKGKTMTTPWISDSTWRLEYQRETLGMNLTENQRERRTLKRRSQSSLKEEMRFRARKTGK